ncbi:MAG: nucleotide sugar dehydrogenase, partial [Parabacteroides sp.]|nr:nucleotide sugar dehydrogenase [Parabacteroides sp.]
MECVSGLYERIKAGNASLAVIGLGYVGMPLAVAFSKYANVIGFDTNKSKIELYKGGIDPTLEVGNDAVLSASVQFTADESSLREAKFHIIAVPTPVNPDKTPD